jgi:hypothetical protein
MAKEYIILSIRIEKKERDKIKKYGGNFSDIFRRGYEIWQEEIPELLDEELRNLKKREAKINELRHKCIYNVSTNSMQNRYNVSTKNPELDKIVQDYLETGRSREKPSNYDKSWVKSRLESKKIRGVDVDKFFEIIYEVTYNNKQRNLEVA